MTAASRGDDALVSARPEDDDDVVAQVAHELASPTAPGHDDSEVVAVDLDEVAPEVAPARGVPLVVGAAAAVVLLGVGLAVVRSAPGVPELDQRLHDLAVGARVSWDIGLASTITQAGATVVALPVVALVGAWAPRGPRPWRDRLGSSALLLAIAGTGVYVGLMLNHAIDRPRPSAGDWAGAAGGPAFPSGHTTMATLLAGTCAWALLARVTSRRGRLALGSAAVALAVGVGWSRWWLGVHWPTDVVGGWALGAAWCALCVAGITAWRRRSTDSRRAARPSG